MNCKIVGSYIQHLEVTLERGEEFYAERGAMIFKESGIESECLMNGNGLGQLIGARLSGESIIIIRYVNRSVGPQTLAIGSRNSLHPVKLGGMEMICRGGAYVASNKRVKLSTKLSLKGLTGGMGLFLQRLRGDCTVFLETVGQPRVIDLKHGESIQIDENHLVALHGIPQERIQSEWSFKNLIGGEGVSVMNVTGPGTVILSPGIIPIAE